MSPVASTQNLLADGAPVGEQVRMVRMRGTADADHAGQRRFGAQPHVQRLHGQPDRIDAGQPRTSRSQAALRASIGSSACTAVTPRRISTEMRLGTCTDADGKAGGTSCGMGS